jgi:hypothetical protein
MASKKMEAGLTRMGHVVSTDDAEAVISVTFDDRGVTVVWPRELDMFEAFQRNESHDVPDVLIFRDDKGFLTLREGGGAGMSMSTLGSSVERLRFRSVVETGSSGADYAKVNGMSSEVDGLARWAKMHPVTGQIEFHGPEKRPRVVIAAENLASKELGGQLDLTLETSFTHHPTPKNGVYSISEALTVRTRSRRRKAWQVHATEHHMMQDLMCLVYAHPCKAAIRSVMRTDDQPMPIKDGKYWWPNVYEPSFGRGTGEGKALPEDRRPFFYLDEADSGRIAAWLSDFQLWSRPTWIAVTTMFQQDSTVESQLLQVGVALEALGYAIWRQAKPSGSKTPAYVDLLKHVTEAVGIQHPLLYGKNVSAGKWRDRFNAAFKGAKHADNPLPSGHEAVLRARQGFLLIRCWLALELGVPRRLVRERLGKIEEGSWR